MIPRRWSRLLFLLFFLLIVLTLYSMLQSIGTNRGEEDEPRSAKDRIGERLHHLEESIRNLDKSLKSGETVKPKERPIPPPPPVEVPRKEAEEEKPDEVPVINLPEKKETSAPNQQCIWRKTSPANTTFEIRQLYDTLPFDDINGGVWKQGFDITYDPSQWTSTKKLKVILMPHSHCDPGWLQTFEGYFSRATKFILDTVISILDTNPKYKFIWAEMSYLSLWWDQASTEQKTLLKKLVDNKQLEIVTGGWVMNDEANTHYFAMLDQLIEGHQFLENNLGNVTIQAGWANDPFGYSPTMAYLLRSMGVQYMSIQRVHYHIKKALAKEKKLEFYWQQTWDRTESTRILTHVMPFYSYDVPHTCGPDPKICCQFDFRRAAGSDMSCPWGINPIPITDENVRERAQVLLDQYRKKAQLYRTNVLFVQLGDDFRYISMDEARKQFGNYEKLFNYMNTQTDWNVDAQFGTLSDFFEQLSHETSPSTLPSYMGDFFTYADRVDHYWSGYYTSRSFFKRMDRVVESYLRASEILFSLAHIKSLEQKTNNSFPEKDLFKKLVQARRNLGLFQHHDGITGTAKDHVVNDYGEKLYTSITSAQNIMEQAAAYFLYPQDYSSTPDLLKSNTEFHTFESLPTKKLISIKNGSQTMKVIYIYNPTDQRRSQIVKVLLDTHAVTVKNDKQMIRPCQIDPKWKGTKSNIMENDRFELLFLADVEAYSLKAYTIHASSNEQACPLSNIEYMNEKHRLTNPSAPFIVTINDKKSVRLKNRFLSIRLSTDGTFQSIHHLGHNEKISFQTQMIRYGTSEHADHNSGAYLFLPNGEGKEVPMGSNDFVRVQRGPLVSRIDVLHEMYGIQYQLTNTNGSDDYAIDIGATTHLTLSQDIELALRFQTSIKNGDNFFTDLNGFQVIRRKTYTKLPLQGNVYPMPTMAFMEDDHMRFTVLSGQPSGVASLQSGAMEVFLDRRLQRDDNRGVGQGVTDNREILSRFKLIVEPRRTIADQASLAGYPTLLAHHQSMELLYPMHLFQSKLEKLPVHEWNLFNKVNLFPGDYHLVNLRTLNQPEVDSKMNPSKNVALILRRFAYDCDDNYDPSFHFEQPVSEHFFPSTQIDSVERTTLTLRHHQQSLTTNTKFEIAPAELMTLKIRIK